MAKDPAVLFYTSDFLTGTITMTDEQIGKYIRLLCLQHQKGKLTKKDMLQMCGSYDEDVFFKFEKDKDGFYYNERMREEINKRKRYVESRRNSRLKCPEDKVRIYLIYDNETRYTKIGSSVNPKRRYAEMCRQENPAITVGANRDYDLIFESDIVPRTEEKKLQDYFNSKRITGEWFDLSDKDVSYVRRTYEKRTTPRTENENENENKDKDLNAVKRIKVYKEILNYLNQATNSKFKATAAHTKHINARLDEGYSLNDFTMVIDKKVKDWTGTEWEKYLRPQTLFGTKFDGYLNEKEKKQKSLTGNDFADMVLKGELDE